MSENLPAVHQPQHHHNLTAFSGPTGFEAAQRMAMALVSSTMVPEAYRGKDNLGNAIIALEMAQRVGASPMAVMQNLHIIHGRPSWSSAFIIAALNSCGRFSPLRFRVEGEGDARICVAWANERGSSEVLEGPPASIEMAKAEGWYSKNGSKWKTMPELMLRYRAAAFFGRLYAPDILMGMHSEDEVQDIGPARDVTPAPAIVQPEPAKAPATEKAEPEKTGDTPTLARPAGEPEEKPVRERGKPAQGKQRRTSEEVEEDRLADEADALAAEAAAVGQAETVEAEVVDAEPEPEAEPEKPAEKPVEKPKVDLF
jgi:hypothetical protein